jgi:hypothetical protein
VSSIRTLACASLALYALVREGSVKVDIDPLRPSFDEGVVRAQNAPMDEASSSGQSSRLGATIVLVGAAGFVLSCFFPYYRVSSLTPQLTVSLYRLEVVIPAGATLASHVGGVMLLFGGVAVVTWMAVRELQGTAAWTAGALAAVTAVWSLEWIGALLRLTVLSVSFAVGYWLILTSVGLAVVGSILVILSSRSQPRVADVRND